MRKIVYYKDPIADWISNQRRKWAKKCKDLGETTDWPYEK